MGSRRQVTWVSWVLEPIESSAKDFVDLKINPANPGKTWLFICFSELT